MSSINGIHWDTYSYHTRASLKVVLKFNLLDTSKPIVMFKISKKNNNERNANYLNIEHISQNQNNSQVTNVRLA